MGLLISNLFVSESVSEQPGDLDLKIYFFSMGQFKTILEPTVQILRAMSCHSLSQKNLFLINHSHIGPL